MTSVLKKLRQLMALKNLNVYVLPRTDEHQSQYLCACDERVSFISGFTGSNAIALISQDQALLWTDGRYFLQAQKELTEGWSLRKMVADQKKWFQHITAKYPQSKVSIDGRLISAESAQLRRKYLMDQGIVIEFTNSNLIDQIWEDRPKSSATQIFLHQDYAGKSMSEKVNWVRGHIKNKQGEAALFSDLSEIAWILNIRSNQIPFNPFAKSILIIEPEKGTLYLPKNHPSLHSEILLKHLSIEKITIKQYDPIYPQKVLCMKSSLNYITYSSIKEPIQWEGIGLYRAVREQKQIEGFKRCHVSDGIAMAKFWTWRSKQDSVDELVASDYIDGLRKQQKLNMGLSFQTISGGGPNGAVIHYHATSKNSSLVTKDMTHLVDSGGQYLDGTTDVTRAFNFGNPTLEERDSFTRVLLGNLDLERVQWPKNVSISGADIDILARRHLFAKGLDYGHGTGHGVGYFEGVHQGPCGISKYNKTVFKPGMIVTNEPGYYEPGKYGIRIQNMLLVIEKDGVYKFHNLTLCPYDKNLIDVKLLTQNDKDFINSYHQRVWDTISPHLKDDQQSTSWLHKATSPL